MSVGCILLAAGNARRFGRNKLMFPVDGKPMAQHAVNLHEGLPYLRRILVTQFAYEDIRRFGEAGNWEMLYNVHPELGQSSSIALGIHRLTAAQPHPDGVLFCVADQPYLTSRSVQALIEGFEGSPHRIVSLSFEGTRGNPVIFPYSMMDELAALQGDVGGSVIIRKHEELLLRIPSQSQRELNDIDWYGDKL